jgi:hypothetical protein
LTQDAAMDGTDPATNAAAYTVLPRATADMGYITEYDPIEYDWSNDWLQYREDKRGNKYRYDYTTDVSNQVYGSSTIPLFQWGNDFVFGNIAQNSFLNIVNSFPSSVYFFYNELGTGSLFYNNTFAANCSFYLNFLRASCDFHNNTFAADCILIYNTIGFGCGFYDNVFGAASIFSYNEIKLFFNTNTTNASVVVARNIFHIAITGITYSANYDDNTLLPGIVNIPSGSTYNIDGSPHTHDVVPSARTITTTAPLTIEGGASADLSADRTIAITAATTGAAGSMSAADKTKLDGLSAGSWTTVRKTADESKASDTTLGADTHLRFTAVASKTYAVRGRVWFSTPAAADFKFRFTFTSGASIFIHHVSIPCGSATETVGMENATPTTTISCLGTGTTGGYVEFDGVIIADASNRTFALQWAQVTSNAGNTTVKAGSYVEHLLVD